MTEKLSDKNKLLSQRCKIMPTAVHVRSKEIIFHFI